MCPAYEFPALKESWRNPVLCFYHVGPKDWCLSGVATGGFTHWACQLLPTSDTPAYFLDNLIHIWYIFLFFQGLGTEPDRSVSKVSTPQLWDRVSLRCPGWLWIATLLDQSPKELGLQAAPAGRLFLTLLSMAFLFSSFFRLSCGC